MSATVQTTLPDTGLFRVRSSRVVSIAAKIVFAEDSLSPALQREREMADSSVTALRSCCGGYVSHSGEQ